MFLYNFRFTDLDHSIRRNRIRADSEKQAWEEFYQLGHRIVRSAIITRIALISGEFEGQWTIIYRAAED